MQKKIHLAILLLFLIGSGYSQSQSQNIKGQITDKQSKQPLPGVTLWVNTNPPIGAYSDSLGNYRINSLPLGRYELRASFVGYKEIVIPNVSVSSGKEIVVDIELEESTIKLQEVVVTDYDKHQTINEMASVSSRAFTMEEVNRYAGGRSDPSRLVSNFAGVSSPNDSRNDIVIRGNSPVGVLWRIEGLTIPNPNHFSTIGTTGGPVSALNTNMLKNSDFFTSAFPAEYGNATAGVFDLGFRNGNKDKREHTIQFGVITGLEAMTEGPINKEKGSSYALAYRYAFTAIAQKLSLPIGTTSTPYYQDLTFKINSAYTKAGRLTLFGIGGKSKINFKHDNIDKEDLFAEPGRDIYFTSDIGLIGLKHFIRLNSNSYLNTIIGVTSSKSTDNVDSMENSNNSAVRIYEKSSQETRYSFAMTYGSKVSAKLFYKAGVEGNVINLNLNFRERVNQPGWNQIWSNDDYTTLLKGFTQAKYNINDQLTANIGFYTQYLMLNHSYSFEPRVGIKYTVNNSNTLSVGYGNHSQMQTPDVYFYRLLNSDGIYDESNKQLGFTKSNHFVLGYEALPFPEWRIKTEVYYQNLYQVPVSKSTNSFSMLNNGASFEPIKEGKLENNGKGKNYGIEITIEKFFNKGYYGLLTGSLYEAKYKGSDNIERNTAFNGRFIYNVLLGKEFKLGKEKNNTLSFDIKFTQAGGRYYTPIDLLASQNAKEQVELGDAYAFSKQYPDFLRLDFKVGYSINSQKRKLSQSIILDIQNVTDNRNVFAQRYNYVTNSINTSYQISLFPNLIYKIQF